MAAKKSSKPARKPMGRPTKSDTPTVVQISVRLTEDDQAFLETIRAEEQARADAVGLMMRVSPADALRILLRSEARRRHDNTAA